MLLPLMFYKPYIRLSAYKSNIPFTGTPKKLEQSLPEDTHKRKKQIALAATGAVLIAAGAYFFVRSPKRALATLKQHSNAETLYQQTIAQALSKRLNKTVKADDLCCLMNRDQFLSEIKTLKKDNYILNSENVSNGMFCADLHSHSLYSDGKIAIPELMEELSNYSKTVFEKTGKKFLFSLTDHDGIEGVQEALEIIAKDPAKFKYMNFVTGSEISYAHKSTASHNPCETSELLAYCFNPFSENITNFFNNIKVVRENFVKAYIRCLKDRFPDVNYNYEEFRNIFAPEKTMITNIHWRVFHYGQTKKAVAELAKLKNEPVGKLYMEIMSKAGKNKSLGSLKDKKLVPDYLCENSLITELHNKFKPDYKDKVETCSEKTVEEIFNAFSQDKGTVMGFAHPYYMTERLYDVKTFAGELVKKSNGLIKLTESWHQAYRPKIPQHKIEEINKILEEFNLLPLGGRDNHNCNWLAC